MGFGNTGRRERYRLSAGRIILASHSLAWDWAAGYIGLLRDADQIIAVTA